MKENLLLQRDLSGLYKKKKKKKIYKNMTAILKNVYFYVLDDIIHKYDNTYYRRTKMKPIDVSSDSFAEYNEESN